MALGNAAGRARGSASCGAPVRETPQERDCAAQHCQRAKTGPDLPLPRFQPPSQPFHLCRSPCPSTHTQSCLLHLCLRLRHTKGSAHEEAARQVWSKPSPSAGVTPFPKPGHREGGLGPLLGRLLGLGLYRCSCWGGHPPTAISSLKRWGGGIKGPSSILAKPQIWLTIRKL